MSTRPRTRLSPEARTSQILATARQMIVDSGLQSFTMEALARAAGVSTPLVYNYFASRQELLQTLLQQEHGEYSAKLAAAVEAATSFEEVVRIFIASNFDHHAPGNILPILQSQPEIATAIKQIQATQLREVGRFLVQQTATNYQLTRPQAELAASMSSGASIAAAEYAARNQVDREHTIDTVLSYVMAGMVNIAELGD